MLHPTDSQVLFYQPAMVYFAQALKLADDSSKKSIHRQVSQLFMRLIEKHFLQNDTFKNRIEQAKSQGNLKEVEQLLLQLESLKKFCCAEQDQKIIKTLYIQARDVLDNPYRKDFEGCLDKVSKGISTRFEPPHQTVTEKYHIELQRFREEFLSPPPLDPAQVRKFQTTIASKFQGFVCGIFDDVLSILGPFSGSFDLRAMGSAGREELCPFSDLEPLILCENEEYFSKALLLFQLMIYSLGETPTRFLC